MNLNNLNKRQQAAYTKVCDEIRTHLGSYNSIAMRMFAHTSEEVTGETVRNWFLSQKIPIEYCFVLYEMMGRDIDLFALLPWLAEYVELKAAPKASE
jgi:hypothetical protein